MGSDIFPAVFKEGIECCFEQSTALFFPLKTAQWMGKVELKISDIVYRLTSVATFNEMVTTIPTPKFPAKSISK